MKKHFCLLVITYLLLSGCLWLSPLFAQNKICLSQNQTDLIKLPKTLNNYTLSQFNEAYQYFNTSSMQDVKGTYCVFELNSPAKKSEGNSPAYLSEIIYVSANGKAYSDLLYISQEDYYRPQKNLKKIYSRDYIKFDDKGNCFIAVTQNSTNQKGVLMYSPLTNSKKYFSLPEDFPNFRDFEISNDGNYVLINGRQASAAASYQTFIFNTKTTDTKPERVFDAPLENVSNIVFSTETQSFYIIYLIYDSKLDYNEKCGLAAVRKTSDIYSKSSTTFFNPQEINPHGDWIDYWGNIFIRNEENNKLYQVNYFKPGDLSQVFELIDKGTCFERIVVNAASNIFIEYDEASLDKAPLKSTPIGLYIKNNNGTTYLFQNGEIQKTTDEDIAAAIENYNEMLFKTSNSDYFEEKNINLKNSIIFIIGSAVFLIAVLLIFIILLLASQKKLQQKILQKKILAFQETERAKLSREIHDSVVQDIRAVRLQTELIDVGQNEKSLAQKNRVIDDLTQAIVKMRNICYNLTPAELMTHKENDDAQVELISIFDALCHQFYERSKIPCSIQITPDLIYPSFEKDVSLNLVRIFQEALNNIEKHSYATNVNILVRNKIEDEQNYLVIFIIDDGVGCNIEEILKNRRKNHFGLQNMQERMELVGGTIEFFSAQNEGMKIKMEIKI